VYAGEQTHRPAVPLDDGAGRWTEEPSAARVLLRSAEARPAVGHPDPQPRAGPNLVYDPFLGSGTTLVPAETLGRRCYGLEIDPRYCQVVIERWQGLTGRTAERVDDAPVIDPGMHHTDSPKDNAL
jgi:DNA methylase